MLFLRLLTIVPLDDDPFLQVVFHGSNCELPRCLPILCVDTMLADKTHPGGIR